VIGTEEGLRTGSSRALAAATAPAEAAAEFGIGLDRVLTTRRGVIEHYGLAWFQPECRGRVRVGREEERSAMFPLESRITKHQDRFAFDCSLDELKRIYLALFSQLRRDPLADIDETDLLLDLQVLLQREAQAKGVDVSNHSEWSRFLGDGSVASCEQRYAAYDEKKRNL
jgi:hypothetical protein